MFSGMIKGVAYLGLGGALTNKKEKELMITRVVWTCFFALALSACVGPVPNVSESFKLDDASEQGVMVGSVKYKGAVSGYKVYFRGLDNETTGYLEAGKGLMLLPIPPRGDFSTIKGELYATELPAGEYEAWQWDVHSGAARTASTRPFSIKFNVRPGEITYIGSFIFTVTKQLGLTVTGVSVDYEERFAEDIAILRRDYPNLVGEQIYLGLERGLVKTDLGGSGSTRWTMMPVMVPAGM